MLAYLRALTRNPWVMLTVAALTGAASMLASHAATAAAADYLDERKAELDRADAELDRREAHMVRRRAAIEHAYETGTCRECGKPTAPDVLIHPECEPASDGPRLTAIPSPGTPERVYVSREPDAAAA